jgi:hypothetical protein
MDNGQILVNHPLITFLAHKEDMVKDYAKKYFAQAVLSKVQNHGVMKLDAEQMKQ